MNPRRASALLAVVAATGCGSTKTTLPVLLDQPTGVAAFMGVTVKNSGLHPYVAVSNGGREDLTLLDALDDKPVLSPILLRALAVITKPRPGRLLSGSLHDVDGLGQPLQKADFLGVVLQGSPVMQGVRTWTEDNQVVDALELDLGGYAPGSDVVFAITAPVPDATGAPVPGKIRILFALTGQRLAVAEYDRDPGDGEGIVPGPVTVQDLDFQPMHLAVAEDPRLVYAATLDEVPAGSGRHGVVELDASGAPGTWTEDLLDARGPTRFVAALDVGERDFAVNSVDVKGTEPHVPRVYAMLDSSGCGPAYEIECGIVTIDPAPGVRGVVPDPLGELPYQPPMRLPASPIAMVPVGLPAQVPDTWIPGTTRIHTALGMRDTAAVLAVAAADGRIYPVDLSRRTLLNDKTMLRDVPNTSTQTRTRCEGVATLVDPDSTAGFDALICKIDDPGTDCTPVSDVTARDQVVVTPGYTFTELFSTTWQGVLPGLGGFGFGHDDTPTGPKAMTVGVGGKLRVALQVPTTGTGYTEVVRVYDPALGVRRGDILQLATFDGNVGSDSAQVAALKDACDVECGPVPAPGCVTVDETRAIWPWNIDAHDYVITDILPPDPVDYPGGALVVDDDGKACTAALMAGATPRATVRAAGWMNYGSNVGYAGRPTVFTGPEDPTNVRVHVELRYSDQDAPDKDCPLAPWPANPETVACDDDCRLRCENRLLSHLARRWYTMADQCAEDTGCRDRWGNGADPFPNKTGPVVQFEFTIRKDNAQGVPKPTLDLERDLGYRVSLNGGHAPTTFYPAQYVVWPADLALFDKSPWNVNASTRFFVAYMGDEVYDFSPSEPINLPTLIR